MEDLTGHEFGPYRIIAPCGEGGMAAVYKAYQASMDRYVALKVLPRYFASDKRFLGRFDQEAKVLARLQHPYILPVHDYGEHDGYTYIVMPLVETGSLADRLHEQPLSLNLVERLISQVADALDYAHSEGVVRRDVKPSNILVDARGNSLLTDFGIAKIVQSAASFTQTGGILGTPAYMSPEQILGEPLDGRSDIYSLGIVLYEMVTGRPPFKAETPAAIFVKHLHDPLPLPRQFLADLPEPIERVILKALAKKREARFQTAAELAAALTAAVAGRSDALAAISPDLVAPPSTELGIPSELVKHPAPPAEPAAQPSSPPPADTSVPTWVEPAAQTPPDSIPSYVTPPPAAPPADSIPSYVTPTGRPITPLPAQPADDATAIAIDPAAAHLAPSQSTAIPASRPVTPPPAAEFSGRVTPVPTPPHASRPPAEIAAERPVSRRGVPSWVWGLGALVLVAAIVGIILAAGRGRQEPTPTAQPAVAAAEATATATPRNEATPTDQDPFDRAMARLGLGANAEALALFDQALAAGHNEPDLYTGRAAACVFLAETGGDCDPQQALADVDHAIEMDPASAWAHNVRGHIFRHLGDPEAAGPDLEKSVELAPDDPGFRGERAWYYAETGQYDAALADWNIVISVLSEEAWPWIGRGWTNAETDDPDAAIRDLSKAIELNPGESEAYAIRARAWEQLGDRERQLEDLNAAIELQPENVGYYSDRAWWYTNTGDPDAAITDWQRAIELDPQNASYWTEIGWRLYELGDFENALEHFGHAQQLAPDDTNPRFGKARALEGMGDLHAAITEWNWLVLAFPDNPEALAGRAEANSQVGELAKAIADLRRAIELDPQNPGYRVDLAWKLFNTGQNDAAREQFEQAVTLAPDEPWTHEALAWFFNSIDQPGEAVAAMSRAIAAAPDKAEYWQNRGWIQLWQGELEKARADFEAALERDPKDPWATKGMGIYYRDSGNSLDLSLEYLDRAVELRPDDPGMYFERAMTTMQMGQPSASVDDLSIAIDLVPQAEEWPELWAHRAQALDALNLIDAARADYLTFMDLIMGRAEPYWLEWLSEVERWLVAHPEP